MMNISKNKQSSFTTLVMALGLSAVMALPAQASDMTGDMSSNSEWSKEKTGIMAGTSIAGAVLGGPIGFVLGVAAGDWLGDSVNTAKTADTLQQNLEQERDQALAQLETVETRLETMENRLALAQQEAGRYQSLALDSLQLNVMFRTADHELSIRDKARLNVLVRLLNEKPDVQVQLAGFADPRGRDKANLELSHRRAKSVQDYLLGQGVEAGRILTSAYGASHSQAEQGNLDAYALERIVTIELQETGEQLAAHQ